MHIAETLQKLGFNIQLLGSEKYVLNKLQSLKAEGITRIKEAFIQNKAPRFMKYFFPHQPYGKQKLYNKKLMESSLERLAHLIKVCGLLLQTKVYLFWEKSEGITVNCEADYEDSKSPQQNRKDVGSL